ncbi:hypothetical protein PIB30_036039 [Stylosanthes scabra]|uniref:Uncharacterized protein n=1 Tax=Stylosanthes scabra TaxID=79078 RepID=A0ABU6YC30_9FABA|nr:hypothetical protein [Stylosanthes scabra]
MDSMSDLSLLEITAEDDSLLLDASTAGGDSNASTAAVASNVFSCSPLISLRSLPRTNASTAGGDSDVSSAAVASNVFSCSPLISLRSLPRTDASTAGGGYDVSSAAVASNVSSCSPLISLRSLPRTNAFTAGGDSDISSAAVASNVLSGSPRISLRSLPRTNGRVGDVNAKNASAAPQKDSKKCDENMIWNNKPEAAKLSMEAQQMKRKKKGGGYNLRKSLAWNRAFFEEEGVLNPLELSMISGTSTPKRLNRELKAINEEEPGSVSIALQEIEENLFNQSSEGVVCTENRSGNRSAAAFLSPKSGVLTKAKRKVPAINDTVVNRPKRNAPEPVKAPNTESKVTKIPRPKAIAPVVANTPRRGTLKTSLPKRNHNAEPATNVQKYAGAKGLPKIPRTVPLPNKPKVDQQHQQQSLVPLGGVGKPKVDQTDKCSISKTVNEEARKHLDSSISEKSVPTGQHQSGSRGPNVSEACLPQVILDTSEKKLERQFQTTKPSGLRMPSPSLGFFSQAKPSNSRSQLQKSSKPCKPGENNFPKLRKLETHNDEARLPQVSSKVSDTVEGTINNDTQKFSLPDVKSEASIQVKSNHLTALAVESHSCGPGKISKQEMVENKQNFMNAELHVDLKSKEQAKLLTNEGTSNMEDTELPRHEQKLLSKSHSHEQLEKEVDLPLDDKLHDVLSSGNQLVVQEPEPITHHTMHRTLVKKDNISNEMHIAMVQDEEQITSNVLTSNESLLLQQKDTKSSNNTRHSGDFKEYNHVKTAEVNDDVGGYDKQGDAAQTDVLNGNPSANCSVTTPSISGIVNQQLQGEQINIPNHSIVGEISSEIENESQENTCEVVCVTTVSFQHHLEKSIPEIRVVCESQPKVAESEACQHVFDDKLGSIPRSVDEGSHQIIDSKAMNISTQPVELDRMCEDCLAVSTSVCGGEVNNVSPGSKTFSENNTENIHSVKADCDSRANDMLINDHCIISECQLSDDDSSMDTSMSYDDQFDAPGSFEQQAVTLPEWQLGDDGSSRHISTQVDDHHDVPENFEQQAESSSHSETNKMVYEDESLVKTEGHLLDENGVCAVTGDFIWNTKDSICGGSEHPSCLLQHIASALAVTEFDHTMRKSEKSLANDVQPQYLVENPKVHNCNSEQSLSVAKDQLPLVGDTQINEKSHLSELRSPTVVYANSPHINNVMHLEGDGVPLNTAYSEEIKSQSLFEGASKGSIISTSENSYSNNHSQVTGEYKDGNLEADDRLECLQMGNVEVCPTDILPTEEVQHIDQVVSAEFDSSIKGSEDSTAEVLTCKSDVHCSSVENSNLPASDNEPLHTRIPEGSEVCSSEAKSNILEDHEYPNIDTQNEAKGYLHSAEESSKITHDEKSAMKSKLEVPSVKIPPNVVPFSDEWLAAIEAAGEEILTMKGGAVQNSPPEKPQHEPSPWSPVRKNQAIGPYDCTKHTNIPHSDSS